MHLSFKVPLKNLKSAIARLKELSPGFNRKAIIWFTISDKRVIISAPNVKEHLDAETVGVGDVSIPFIVISGYLKTIKSSVISLSFEEGEMTCGNSIFSSPNIHVSKNRS